MAFGINARGAKYARNYEECAALFEQPGFIGLNWNSQQRGLDGRRKHHMRVEQGEGYFDVVLYHTAMARYFQPEGATREVWHNVHGSQSSSAFQWNVLGFGANNYTMTSTENKSILIGMNPNTRGEFPVRLRLVNGKLKVSASRDAPAEIGQTTSPERKQQRKEFKAWLRPYEAMSKIMEGPTSYLVWSVVSEAKQSFITKELFDPTRVCNYIRANGVTKLVDAVFPLGDVANYNPSFKELM